MYLQLATQSKEVLSRLETIQNAVKENYETELKNDLRLL